MIITGALKGIGKLDRLVHSGEKSLSLNILEEQLKFVIKFKHSNTVVYTVALDHLKNYCGNHQKNSRTLVDRAWEFCNIITNLKTVPKKLSDSPPLLRKQPVFDTSLCSDVRKADNPVALAFLTRELVLSHEERISVYTDASISWQGRVGFGVFFDTNPPVPFPNKFSFRMNDNISIFKAEFFGINFAALEIYQSFHTDNNLVLYDDSLYSIASLKTSHSLTNNNLVQDIFSLIKKAKYDRRNCLDS